MTNWSCGFYRLSTDNKGVFNAWTIVRVRACNWLLRLHVGLNLPRCADLESRSKYRDSAFKRELLDRLRSKYKD